MWHQSSVSVSVARAQSSVPRTYLQIANSRPKMMLGTIKRCCPCIGLQTGSFIIGYLLMISRVIQFIFACIRISGVNTAFAHHLAVVSQDLGFTRLILSFEIMIIVFEILITLVLLNGLHKRIQDQVQMWYVGALVFEVLRIALVTVVIMRYANLIAKLYGPMQWILLACELIGHLVYYYFIVVVRSYYFLMKEEDSPRYNVFTESPVQLKINK